MKLNSYGTLERSISLVSTIESETSFHICLDLKKIKWTSWKLFKSIYRNYFWPNQTTEERIKKKAGKVHFKLVLGRKFKAQAEFIRQLDNHGAFISCKRRRCHLHNSPFEWEDKKGGKRRRRLSCTYRLNDSVTFGRAWKEEAWETMSSLSLAYPFKRKQQTKGNHHLRHPTDQSIFLSFFVVM